MKTNNNVEKPESPEEVSEITFIVSKPPENEEWYLAEGVKGEGTTFYFTLQ